MKRLRSVLAIVTGCVLALAVPTAVWSGPLPQVDPFGNPLPPTEQVRQQVERLLGQPIPVRPPVRGNTDLRPAAPFEGPDVPVAYTQAEIGITVQALSGDLAETPDVRFTPEILEVVQRFGGDPEQLYLYVKNNFAFTPYVGSQKGSQGTRLEFSGNDFDQSSLLIALLRAAGIPARYVVGSMFIPIGEALNWLGVEKPDVALRILQWQGVPAQLVNAGGGSLLMNRVWVEAFLVRHGPKPRWVPMDPAFKQYTVLPGSRIARQVQFSRSEYLSLPVAAGRTAYEFFRDRVQAQLDATQPGTTIEDIERDRVFVPTTFPRGLPGRLENRARVAGELAALSDDQRYRVTLLTVDNLGVSGQVTLRLPEVYGKRLTVSFPPATAADEALVQQFGGYYNVPADLLHVRPVIKLDGQPLASGSRSVSIGQGHFLVVDFLFPGFGLVGRIFHTVFAGGYYAVGLDTVGDAGPILLDARAEQYRDASGTTNDPSYSDAEIGDRLSLAALEYLDNVEQQIVKLGALLHNVQVEDVAEALTGQDIRIEFINGILRFRPIGWFVDAKRFIARHFAVDGDESDREKKWQIMGLSGSYLENRLWEEYAGLPSISTALGLQFAHQVGISILTIDQGNIATLLPTLNVFPHVRQAVIDAVNAGRVVTIPRDTLVFHDWVGSVWIDDLPGGLSTGYLISGGILGGNSGLDPEKKKGENPDCKSVSDTLGADDLKATAWQENKWGQFEPDKRPTDRKGDIGTMQVNRPTWVKQDAQGNPLPTIDIDGDGRKDPVDLDRLQYNWQYNINVGTAIYQREFGPKAEAHLNSLVGAGNYMAAQLVTETYFLYNHGGNAKTKDGTKAKVFYYTKDASEKLARASYPDLTEKDQKIIDKKQDNADEVRGNFEALQARDQAQDPTGVKALKNVTGEASKCQ